MLSRTIGRYLSWPINGLARLIAPTHIPPNVITWVALGLNLWAGILFAQGRFAAGGGMMILAGLCDLLDGPVARIQNRVSIFGGFLDSIFDRYADLILFLGLLVYYASVNRFGYAFLAGAAMAGAVMVSYAKARAESLVPNEDVGFWDRPERLVLMIIGALANRMPPVLWILAIGPNITVIHRIVHTWKQTKEVTTAPKPVSISAPAPLPLEANLSHGAQRPSPQFFSRTAGARTVAMPKLLAIIGALVICAGIDLLWQSRNEIKFWLAAYINVFRSILRRQESISTARVLPAAVPAAKRKHAVRFLLGVGFAFLLGPMLIAISVTLLLYTNL